MEIWNWEILESWHFGILALWKFGILKILIYLENLVISKKYKIENSMNSCKYVTNLNKKLAETAPCK